MKQVLYDQDDDMTAAHKIVTGLNVLETAANPGRRITMQTLLKAMRLRPSLPLTVAEVRCVEARKLLEAFAKRPG